MIALSRGLMGDVKEDSRTMLTTVVRFGLNMCKWYHTVPNIPQCTERVLILPYSGGEQQTKRPTLDTYEISGCLSHHK